MIHLFDEFELDTELYELRRNGAVQALEPQVFDMLAYLIEHRDHVATKDELLAAIWPGKVVSESALTSRIKAARRAIGDTGREQRLIKTVRGRGYRFVGRVDTRKTARADPRPELSLPAAAAGASIVGRERELAALRRHAARAGDGHLEIVFVEGEAGLGKTTLIHAFLDGLRAGGTARIAIGQCYERGTAGEAFMPFLDALGELCTEPRGDAVAQALADHAPSWLIQMPWLVTASELETLQRRVIGITRERMLREFAAAAKALCADAPLVIVLEDLHWSDPSTLGLLGWIARRKEAIRLLIVCSYRPGTRADYSAELGETVYNLRLRGLAVNVSLSELDAEAIAAFLAQRFPGCAFPPGLERELEERIDGSPLFLHGVTEAWRERGIVMQTDGGWTIDAGPAELTAVMPDSLRVLITDQLGQLEPGVRAMLEAASVAGVHFAATLVEASIGRGCEAQLARLAEQRSVIVREEDSKWPDGTPVSQFRFRHALFREVAYAGIPAGKRAELHRKIGRRLEDAYGRRASERAADLAVHFSAGQDADKAVEYRLLSANQAFGRGGYGEAIAHLEAGLALLAEQPGIADRDAKELDLQMLLAPALIQTKGWGDARAETALERARELAAALDSPMLPSILYTLAAVHELRGEYAQTEALLEAQHKLPAPFGDAASELASYELMACSLFHQGMLDDALRSADRALSVDNPVGVERMLYVYGENPRASCHNWAGLALALMGFPDRAQQRVEAALEISRAPVRTYSLSNALCQAATLQQLLSRPEEVLRLSEQATAVGEVEGFAYPMAVAQILRGWALAMTGEPAAGTAALERGLELHAASGAHMDRPYYLGLHAEALLRAERRHEALAAVDRALEQIHEPRRFFFESDLLCIKAKILAAQTDRAGAEGLLQSAVRVAREQHNRLGELRAQKALLELATGSERGRRRSSLRKMLEGFSEGFDIPDLRAASELTA